MYDLDLAIDELYVDSDLFSQLIGKVDEKEKEKVIDAMEIIGYYFDEINSDDHYVVFGDDYGMRITFDDDDESELWQGIADYAENRTIDFPDLADDVARALGRL